MDMEKASVEFPVDNAGYELIRTAMTRHIEGLEADLHDGPSSGASALTHRALWLSWSVLVALEDRDQYVMLAQEEVDMLEDALDAMAERWIEDYKDALHENDRRAYLEDLRQIKAICSAADIRWKHADFNPFAGWDEGRGRIRDAVGLTQFESDALDCALRQYAAGLEVGEGYDMRERSKIHRMLGILYELIDDLSDSSGFEPVELWSDEKMTLFTEAVNDYMQRMREIGSEFNRRLDLSIAERVMRRDEHDLKRRRAEGALEKIKEFRDENRPTPGLTLEEAATFEIADALVGRLEASIFAALDTRGDAPLYSKWGKRVIPPRDEIPEGALRAWDAILFIRGAVCED